MLRQAGHEFVIATRGRGFYEFTDGVAAVRDPKGWVVGFDGLRVDLPYAGGAPIQSKVPILGR